MSLRSLGKKILQRLQQIVPVLLQKGLNSNSNAEGLSSSFFSLFFEPNVVSGEKKNKCKQ